MIAPELVKKLQSLKREEKLAVIRLMQADLEDETSEWDDLLSKPGQVFRIPSVRVNFSEAGSLLDVLNEKSNEND